MNYFNGFLENIIIKIQKDGSPPRILYSGKRINERVLEQLEKHLIVNGIEKILQLLPELCLPSITQNNPANDPTQIYSETILSWNPNLLLILDKSTYLSNSEGDKNFPRTEFWKKVPIILEQIKTDLLEFFPDDEDLQQLLSQYIGLYGYVSYEASRHLEEFNIRNITEKVPTSILSCPSNYIIEREKEFLYIELKTKPVFISDLTDSHDYVKNHQITSNLSYESYLKKINSIKRYIVAGDIYQANFTQQFEISKTDIRKHSREIYTDLIEKNPVRHSAYFEYSDLTILSISPELFLSIKNGKILTKPIKGTRPRGHDVNSDQQMMNELIQSDKDQAELSMIVDLLRNDLGKSCKPGTVEVEKHASIESYSNVHHLVSSITAEVEPSPEESWRLFLRAFPGGSITGCPKIRSMEIIEELETVPRGVYTGSIGYLALNGNLQFNIAIRTISMMRNKIVFNSGGGIVADSDPIDEYAESLHKANHLISYFGNTLIGNIIWINGKYKFKHEITHIKFDKIRDGFFETILVKDSIVQNFDKHWMRLNKGLEYYQVSPILPDSNILKTLIKINIAQDARIRLSVIINQDKVDTVVEIFQYNAIVSPQELIIGKQGFQFSEKSELGFKPLDYNNYRNMTNKAIEKGFWDSILVDNLGNLVETGRANIYFFTDRWYTPSGKCVHGITRSKLLFEGKVVEKNIQKSDFKKVKAFAVSNSIVGILPISKIVDSAKKIAWEQNNEFIDVVELLNN